MESQEKKLVFLWKHRKKQMIWIMVVLLLGILICTAAVLWNQLLNQLGDPTQTVPTLSVQEQTVLLGTTMPEETENTWPQVESDENITNIMLVGQNFREDEQNKLSDTMILCSINRQKNTLTMVSFLRDMFVPLPAYAGHGPGGNRINVCYALGSTWKRSSLGGMEMLAKCVEQNFGIPVDHTIEVGFDTFTTIIDTLGGVEVDVTPEEAQYVTNKVGYVEELKPGRQVLNGLETLAFARIRAIDGDVQRTARQRQVITSLIDKCRDLGIMELYQMACNVMPLIVTDMTNEQITNYIFEFLPMVKDIEVRSMTCPVDNETLPGSMWGDVIELYGYQSSVIRCNIPMNRAYLQEQLGIQEETGEP